MKVLEDLIVFQEVAYRPPLNIETSFDVYKEPNRLSTRVFCTPWIRMFRITLYGDPDMNWVPIHTNYDTRLRLIQSKLPIIREAGYTELQGYRKCGYSELL